MDQFNHYSTSPTGKLKKIWLVIKQPNIAVPLVSLLILIIVAASVYNRYALASRQDGARPNAKGFLAAIKVAEEKKVVSLLDGVEYGESVANRHPMGVMIENHPESRPQNGLSSASVVYEALAEGGITRFLAIFGPNIPPKIGPVRSARPHYLDWCLEYQCFYAHVGGSTFALESIKKQKMYDLDQFRYGVSKYNQAYYRQPRAGVATEHTMMANPAKLYAIAENNGWPAEGGQPNIEYKKDLAAKNRPGASRINVPISGPTYNSAWLYDPKSNLYVRQMAGQPHLDGLDEQPIQSKVVIIQEATSQTLTDFTNKNSQGVKTTGTGKAKIFQDGQVTEGSWKKAKGIDQTIFYDAGRNVMRFNAGQRWITVVPPGTTITVEPITQ